MTSRGMISARQRTNSYRPESVLARHIIDTTIYDATINQPVKRCRATTDFIKGDIVVRKGQSFYLVATDFSAPLNRYYIVLPSKDGWTCSSKEASVAEKCITKAVLYRQTLIEKIKQAA